MKMQANRTPFHTSVLYLGVFLCLWFFSGMFSAEAATLKLFPETGVYTVGNTFTVRVVINTQGKSINASDGELSFNPRELSVIGVTRSDSIFSLWTAEPTFSNSAGTVSFGGGSPSGYTGSSGGVVSVTFKALGAGTPKVTFKSGSILAADGMGTNVLTAMGSGAYTVSAQSNEPAPEYVPPPSTPKAPVVTSESHPDPTKWYKTTTARLGWSVPSDVTALRTLLDRNPSTVPTNVTEDLVREKTISDLREGESYFHIQFKNADGWGRVTHFRLGIDTKAPESFTITEPRETDGANPTRTLLFTFSDTSPVREYNIQIDGGESIAFTDTKDEKKYVLPALSAGHHIIVAEAFDSAGNSAVTNYSFDVSAFEAPVITEYPESLNPDIIPVIKGTTRPEAAVTGEIVRVGGEKITMTATSDIHGAFTLIPESSLQLGVYDVTVTAHDSTGAVSNPSLAVRMVVEEPGYLRIGTFVVKVLSVLVPLIALLILLAFGCWYLVHRLRVWRRRVMKETHEAEEKLKTEIGAVIHRLHENVSALQESLKTKLTKAETELFAHIEQDLRDARTRTLKEIEDIEHVVE